MPTKTSADRHLPGDAEHGEHDDDVMGHDLQPTSPGDGAHAGCCHGPGRPPWLDSPPGAANRPLHKAARSPRQTTYSRGHRKRVCGSLLAGRPAAQRSAVLLLDVAQVRVLDALGMAVAELVPREPVPGGPASAAASSEPALGADGRCGRSGRASEAGVVASSSRSPRGAGAPEGLRRRGARGTRAAASGGSRGPPAPPSRTGSSVFQVARCSGTWKSPQATAGQARRRRPSRTACRG